MHQSRGVMRVGRAALNKIERNIGTQAERADCMRPVRATGSDENAALLWG